MGYFGDYFKQFAKKFGKNVVKDVFNEYIYIVKKRAKEEKANSNKK